MRSIRQSRLVWCLAFLLGLGVVVLLGGCDDDDDGIKEHEHPVTEHEHPAPAEPDPVVTSADVVRTNANIAFAGYGDAYATAAALKKEVDAFVADPTEMSFQAAKMAWLRAREAYQPTEVYRFRPGPIEDLSDDGHLHEGEGPEARINGWPLGEALIDYVATGVPDGAPGGEESYDPAGEVGPVYPATIISDTVNIPDITEAAIMDIVEIGDESGIGTGYHAVEFLLWGQDLNERDTMMWTTPRDDTPGQRPVSDYYQDDRCTSGPNPAAAEICMRRATYLQVATALLVDDLKNLVDAWNPNGTYYASYVAGTDSLASILESMGRMGFGELAGERINIARANNSQEDEHSCFSDNTHRDILLNVIGIQNQYLGEYSFEGDMLKGPGIYDLLMEVDASLAEELRMAIEDSVIKAEVIDALAMAGMPFDQQIEVGPDNPDVKGLITALVVQTDLIEQAIQALGLTTGDLEQDTEEDIKDLT